MTLPSLDALIAETLKDLGLLDTRTIDEDIVPALLPPLAAREAQIREDAAAAKRASDRDLGGQIGELVCERKDLRDKCAAAKIALQEIIKVTRDSGYGPAWAALKIALDALASLDPPQEK